MRVVDPESSVFEHFPASPRVATPICSICIANYNGAAMLDDCLASVFAQQSDTTLEVIVHDDASADDSVTMLRAKYPQVELLVSHANVGFCVANNRMVQQARGEFVLLLNNDAALFTDAIVTLLEAASAQRPDGILTLPQFDWTTGALIDRGCLLDPFYNPVPNTNPALSHIAMAIGACLFLKRSLWNELGGFPEWMESIGEDLYLCCLARLRGLPVHAVAASGYRHRAGATFSGVRDDPSRLVSTYRRRRLSERNKTYTMIVCTPTATVWPLLVVHMTLLMIEGAVLALLHLDGRLFGEVYANVLRSLWQQRAVLARTRASVQARRRTSTQSYFATFTFIPRKLALLLRHGLPRIRR